MLTVDKLKKKLDVLNDEKAYLQGLIRKYSEISHVSEIVVNLENGQTAEIIDFEKCTSLFITNVKGNISFVEGDYDGNIYPYWGINTKVTSLDEVKSFVCQLQK